MCYNILVKLLIFYTQFQAFIGFLKMKKPVKNKNKNQNNKEVSASKKKTSSVLFQKKFKAKKAKNVKPEQKKKTIKTSLQKNNFIKSYKQVNNKIYPPRTTKLGGFFDWYHDRIGIRKPVYFILILSVLAVGSIIYYKSLVFANPGARTISSQAEWEAGEYWNKQLDTRNPSGDLKIAAGGVGSWSLNTPGFPDDHRGYFTYDSSGYNANALSLGRHDGAVYGGDLTTDGTYIYMVPGGMEPDLYRYNPELNTWKQLADAPLPFYYGGSITYYDGALYAVSDVYGTSTSNAISKNFYKYDILSDTWSQLTDFPETIGSGTDIESSGDGYIYSVRGLSTDNFWRFDTTANGGLGEWEELSTIPNEQYIYYTNGHTLQFSDVQYSSGGTDYCDSGCVYAFRGGDQVTYYMYDIALNNGQWVVVGDTPGGVHYGGSMALDYVNDKIYAMRGSNEDDFWTYTPGDTGTWDTAPPDMPGGLTVDEGGSLVYYNDGTDGYVYAMPGINRQEFIRYDISNTHWDSILTPFLQGNDGEDDMMVFVPDSVETGGGDGNCDDSVGCLYIARGGHTNDFWKYEINSHDWTQLGESGLGNLRRGSSMCYDGNDTIYAIEGDNTQNSFAYTLSTNSWASIGSTGGNMYYGASITCISDGNFYALRGNNTDDFFYYDGDWNNPLDPADLLVDVYHGGALTNDGTDVYALVGDLRGNFYSYSPGGDTWTELAHLPTSSYYTGTLEYDGDDAIYAIPGHHDEDFYRYDITDGTWSRISDLPQTFRYAGATAHNDADDILYVARGFQNNTIYEFNTETDAYIPSASWISPTYDLTSVDSFTSLTATETEPANTDILYYTRTSDDGVEWNAWSQVVGGTIGSSALRYIQVKVTLTTSDGVSTPTLSDFTITYAEETNDPSNPTVTGYDDSDKAIELVDASSYHYVNPYFELSGASDPDSGVAGYYVAWSTSDSFDPTSSESFYQTGETYEVNVDQTGAYITEDTYYLRVATKDVAGNTSSPATLFTYTYTGIDNASTDIWTAQVDFEATGTAETNINTAAGSGTNMTLDSIANGVWTNEAATQFTMQENSALAYDGDDTIFILRSNGTNDLFSYSVSNKIYTQLLDYPDVNPQYGSAMVYVPNGTYCSDSDGCLFATAGQNLMDFNRYNINANTWTSLTDFDSSSYQIYRGSGMAYDGNGNIYVTAGDDSREFWRYDIELEGGTPWNRLGDLDNEISYGATLAFVPQGDYCSSVGGCVIASKGEVTPEFYMYSVQQNSWEYLSYAPLWAHYGGATYYNDGYLYYTRGYQHNDFMRYDLSNDYWEWLDDIPSTNYYGSSTRMVYVPANDKLYMLRGNNEYSFFRYDVSEDEWEIPGMPINLTAAGFEQGAVAWDSDDDILYVTRGQNNSDFWAYYPDTNEWEQRTSVPSRVRFGATATYADDHIYLLVGDNSTGEDLGYFYKYNPDTDIWTHLTNLPMETDYGAHLLWDGNDVIYTAGGNGQNFYKYEISKEEGEPWEQPWTQLGNTPANIDRGGCAVIDNTNDYIYAVRGEGQDDIYRFNTDIGENPTEVWDAAGTLSTIQSDIGGASLWYGDACVLDGQGNILIPRGDVNNGKEMYVYNISGDSWTERSVLQYFSYGDLVMTNNNVVLGFRGMDTAAMERYVVATASTGFEANGNWTSQVLDFSDGIFAYGGITFNMDEPDDATTLLVETRTCDDDVCTTPGTWTEVDNERIISGTNYFSVASDISRYNQVKITFGSDQLYTPTVNDITWSYYSDSTAPTNPDEVGTLAYTEDGGSELDDEPVWHNDDTPYFEWTASDNAGGIGVKGFYVYFGNDSGMDPISDASNPTNLAYNGSTNFYDVDPDGVTGSFDVATEAASALTSDTYYLIIRTEDQNGNQATSSGTVFTYQIDILDPSIPSGLSATPAGYSSVDDFDFDWTGSTDTGGSGVYQYCYKTDGADTCIPAASTEITGLTAYQPRGNTFSVRSLDLAGNYSSYANTTYYYSGPAPTAPASVTGSPVTDALNPQEDINSFSFTWTLPGTCLGQACDGADILRYCYTINELPSADNCGLNFAGNPTPSPDGGWTTATQTANRLLPGFSAATQQGQNTIYFVAMDIVQNIDYDNYTAEDYYFTSNAPGVPASAAVTDTSDRATQKYSVVMTWDEPADVGSGVTGYDVYRCEASCENPDPVDDPPANYTNIANVNTLGYLDTGLDTLITYSYFARAAGTGGVKSGNSAVLEIKPEGKFKFAPAMSGQPTVTPYIRSALVEWLTLNDQDQYGNTIDHPASSFVEYGETVAYGAETGTSDLVNEHEVTLTNLTPDTTYQFRTKWTDIDGNTEYSSNFEFTTKGAPSAPTGLTATPDSNTTNSFAFDWDAPTDEGVTIAGYKYVVNNLPNEENVTDVVESELAAYDAATQQGINTFYVVAYDDTGNINYSNYAAVEFEAYTTPPGEPEAVTITDSSDRDAKRYSITITWDPPEGYDLDDEIYYTIQRTTGVAPEAAAAFIAQATEDDFSEIATITSTGYLDTGLDSTKEYFYKITAMDKAQATSDPTDTVSEVPEGRYTKPPAITEAPTVTPDSYSATVLWRTERIASSFVEYSTSADALDNEQGTADLIESHEIKVTGLQPETKYYYRVKSIDIDENVAYSNVDTFTTLEAPRVLELKISDIKLFDAIVSWKTNKDTTAIIEYGPTSDYGFTYTDTTGSLAKSHTVKLENLSDSTTYHLRISGVDSSGNPISSDDYTFITLTFPEVIDVSYENKAEGQTEVFWTTNVPTTSAVEYYSEKIPPKTQGNAALSTEHAILLFGLEDATTYTFNVRGSDEFGYEAISDEREFTTLEDTTPPEVFSVQSESNTIGSGEASKVQIVVSWKTDEPTTSQVEYGVGLGGSDYTDQTEENAELVMDHLSVISDLTPAKTYHFRVVSTDKAGNQTKSGSYTVLTSRKRESFLQLIISNLEETFSWLGNIGDLLP